MVISERGPSFKLTDQATLAWFILEARKSGEPIPLGAVLSVGIVACERLTHAWNRLDARGRQRCAVHGTMAPSSIVLSPDGTVKVVRELMSVAVGGGYPRYPELGSGAPTPRADVFSLGVILYELITGAQILPDRPKDPTSPRPNAAPLSLPLEPPSRRRPIPAAVDTVLLRATAEDPAARFADAAELKAALVELAATLGVPVGKDAVAAWYGAAFTPEATRKREAEFARIMGNIGDLVGKIEALKARADKRPAIAVVPPPPTEEQKAAFEKSFAEFNKNREASRRRFEVESTFEDLEALPSQFSSKQALTLFTELTQLGFARLGVKWEVDVFSQNRVASIAFASTAARAFATVYVGHEGQLALFFFTPFQAGGLALTAHYPRPSERSKSAEVRSRPGVPLPELLAEHQTALDKMVASGATLLDAWTQQAMCEATDDWYITGLEQHDDTRLPTEGGPRRH